LWILVFFAEVILAYTAEGAFEIFGKICKLGAGGDAQIRGALLFVINPTANIAYILHI
jgi:hypothetical protein